MMLIQDRINSIKLFISNQNISGKWIQAILNYSLVQPDARLDIAVNLRQAICLEVKETLLNSGVEIYTTTKDILIVRTI